MIKPILSVFLLSALISSNATAWTGIKMGPSERCFVADLDNTTKEGFWYCGSQDYGCASVKDVHSGKKQDYRVWLKKGDKVNWGQHGAIKGGNTTSTGSEYKSKSWYCCGEKFRKGFDGSSYTKTETVTENLPGGGTCTWKKTVTVCGDVVNEGDKCKTADPCPAGQIRRNGSCIKPCPNGQAFQNSTDSTCVPCEATSYRGIINNDYCKTCDKSSQYFINGKCVSKSDPSLYANIIPAINMQNCFRCTSMVNFAKCVKGGTNADPEVLQDCQLSTANSDTVPEVTETTPVLYDAKISISDAMTEAKQKVTDTVQTKAQQIKK